MGLFGTNNATRSIPDLSRYDYHYRGSHVNGYNVESGDVATARQYVRSLSLVNKNSHVKTYPQTRRTIKNGPKKNVPRQSSQNVYKQHTNHQTSEQGEEYYENDPDEENDAYDVVDFDDETNNYHHQYIQNDDYSDEEDTFPQERYNSITSVTTTTTTTTKEVDPVTGIETTTKTVEKTLPNGTVQTTIVKTQKPLSNSRTSSRNNSLLGSPLKGNIRRDQPIFNEFSSMHYNNEIFEEEEEEEIIHEQPQYLKQSKYQTKTPKTKNRIPVYSQEPKYVSNGNKTITESARNHNQISPGRMTEAEMYARALEIAREKVMSDPNRLLSVEATENKKKLKKNKKAKNTIASADTTEIGTKSYAIPRSLRDADVAEPAFQNSENINLSTSKFAEPKKLNKATPQKSSFKLFKMFSKKEKISKKDHQESELPSTVSKEENDNHVAEDSFRDVAPVSDVDLENERTNHYALSSVSSKEKAAVSGFQNNNSNAGPLLKVDTIVLAANNVVLESDYPSQKDIDEVEPSGEPGEEYQDAVEDIKPIEIIKDDGNDITELYNDVADPMLSSDLENVADHADSGLLYDVPLLKTMQSESELREALENLEEENEVSVLRDMNEKQNLDYGTNKQSSGNSFDDTVESEDDEFLPGTGKGNIVDELPDMQEKHSFIKSEEVRKAPSLNPSTHNLQNEPISVEKENSDFVKIKDSEEEKSALNAKKKLSASYSPTAPVIVEELNPQQSKLTSNGIQMTNIQGFSSQQPDAETLKSTSNNTFASKNDQEKGNPVTKKRSKSVGLMSKIVQFSNENYGKQVVKPIKDSGSKQKEKKETKKASKWKLFKKD